MLRARLLRFGVREAIPDFRCAVGLPRFLIRNSYCAVSIQELSEEETSVGECSGAKSELPEGSSGTVALHSGSM